MKKRILSLALSLCLCLALMPAAAATETGITDEIPDVFQGDGLYITVTPWSIQNNSEGWTLAKVGLNEAADENYFHGGFIPVFRNEKEVDEFGYYTGKTINYINYVDTEGNLLNLSGFENPPPSNSALPLAVCSARGWPLSTTGRPASMAIWTLRAGW